MDGSGRKAAWIRAYRPAPVGFEAVSPYVASGADLAVRTSGQARLEIAMQVVQLILEIASVAIALALALEVRR